MGITAKDDNLVTAEEYIKRYADKMYSGDIERAKQDKIVMDTIRYIADRDKKKVAK